VIDVDLRPGPSANVVLVDDVLVDTGSGSPASIERLRAFVGERELSWVALTHFHADHAGGAAALGVPVAAHEAEADTSDPRTGDPWLGFEIPAYRVTRALRDGDVVGPLQVVHTPGQTPGHVAYWHAEERVAITGDLLQVGDVAWVPFGGPWAAGALERTIASLERIAALDPVRTIPGHGPVVTDVAAAVADNLERYARFREEPSRAVWHAVRRATVSHLMIVPRTAASLAALPWVPMAASAVDLTPLELISRVLDGLAERGVVVRDGDLFDTTVAHEPRTELAQNRHDSV
jgi:glyoxylase-like metal-dependent hydrolase (beta-lactamase superfamily II)